MKVKSEKLVPVYAVQYRTPGQMAFTVKKPRSQSGARNYLEDEAKEFTEDAARKVVADFERQGVGARAYHYGWVQRGFRAGEPSCRELCRNSLWGD